MTTTIKLRPEVAAFALLMESRLCDKDEDKGQGWKKKTAIDLTVNVCTAARSIEQALFPMQDRSIKALVDMSNHCMMLADIIGALNEGHEVSRRIDACLDACHGIETDVLEVTHGLDAIYNDIQQERNDLLKALKTLSGIRLGMVADGIVDKAIAKSEGRS